MLDIHLGNYRERVNRALAIMENENVIQRIWAVPPDHTVWKPEPAEISNRLGWLRIMDEMLPRVDDLNDFTASVKAAGFTDALLLGMGGSSLSPDVFSHVFAERAGGLRLSVLDSTHPLAVLNMARRLDLTKTLFVAATKSGTTAETLSFFKFFYNQVSELVGQAGAGRQFVAITDAGSNLDRLASEYKFRKTFLNNPDIGGRYSVLSCFGMVAAALMGLDVDMMLQRSRQAASACSSDVPVDQNPAAVFGIILGELALAGCNKLTFILSPAIARFADWAEQLVAESTGKEGSGILPVVGELPGSLASYSPDRVFVYLKLAGETICDDWVDALIADDRPVVTFALGDRYDLGAQFFIWELATAVAGYRLGINPFNQPNVESAKKLARQTIEAYTDSGTLPDTRPVFEEKGIKVYGDIAGDSLRGILTGHLQKAVAGSYIAVQAYIQPTQENDVRLAALQAAVCARTGFPVTVGYGPRYLHSTGQLHKGDDGSGIFIQLTGGLIEDAPVPDTAGEPGSSMTFGVLVTAQALGDRQALLNAGRPVIALDLGEDVDASLAALVDACQ
nr:glucose-6-phosphate isomerase [Anaerolineae bacterium]